MTYLSVISQKAIDKLSDAKAEIHLYWMRKICKAEVLKDIALFIEKRAKPLNLGTAESWQ